MWNWQVTSCCLTMELKIFLTLCICFGYVTAGSVDPSLLEGVKEGRVHEAILELPQVIGNVKDSPALQSLHGDEKVMKLMSTLQTLTSEMQAIYISKINELGLEYQQFWASNIVLIKGLNSGNLQALAEMQGDFILREQKKVSIYPTSKGRSFPSEELKRDLPIVQPQWGIKMIRANYAWYVSTGVGSVVGIIDTGVYQNHEALRDNFGGAWADPVYNRPAPADGHGHGTHVTGTICGKKNGIGVASGAKWIACRGLDNQGSGTEADLTTCAEFMVSATPRPHVVSCSWGGGQGDTWYNPQIQAWRAAGIIPVFAIGNEGSWCRTAGSPGDQPDLISVGASTDFDTLATFSSRGPSTVGMRIKPEVSAPGERIISADALQGGYVEMSGTSMAAPHAAGAIALILSAHPDWGYDEVFNLLTSSAAHPTLINSDRNCGLPTDDDFPNYAWGWGRIDIGAAFNRSAPISP